MSARIKMSAEEPHKRQYGKSPEAVAHYYLGRLRYSELVRFS
jgi:hypothetical protein